MNDELLIKFLLKETTPEEESSVKNWLEADPANQKHFVRFERLWTLSKNLESKSAVDENAAWLRFKERAASGKREAVVKPLSRLKLIRIAAGLLIAAAGAWSVYSYLKPNSTTLTAGNTVKVEVFPDGSEVTLNKNSVLSFNDFSGNKREVNLKEGEAFFEVKPDKTKPFVIDVGQTTVTVVGTSFNIKHSDKETEVIVESGIVEVSRNNEKLALHAREKVRIGKGEQTMKKEETEDNLHNYYRTKEFAANNTPLWRVVEVLNEAYGVDIVIENPKLRDMKLTSTFKEQPLDKVLSVISATFDIKVEKSGNQIILK